MLISIECLSCCELWPGDAILDAVDGSLPRLEECIAEELCPRCLEEMRNQADPPDDTYDPLEIALRNQYGRLNWREMRAELDLPHRDAWL